MSRYKCSIERVANGYIISEIGILNSEEVYLSLDEVLQRLLSYFEYRGERFDGDRYGRVEVIRNKTPDAHPNT